MNKQVSLPYNSIILANVAPLNKTFECTNLKAFPSFHDPILFDSKITAIYLICLILILVYVNMYLQTFPLKLIIVRILPKSKEFFFSHMHAIIHSQEKNASRCVQKMFIFPYPLVYNAIVTVFP